MYQQELLIFLKYKLNSFYYKLNLNTFTWIWHESLSCITFSSPYLNTLTNMFKTGEQKVIQDNDPCHLYLFIKNKNMNTKQNQSWKEKRIGKNEETI
jgi:hypothetical protein